MQILAALPTFLKPNESMQKEQRESGTYPLSVRSSLSTLPDRRAALNAHKQQMHYREKGLNAATSKELT